MSFACSKSTLIAINIVYVMIAFLLIGVATYGKTSNMITSIPTVGGIVASGVFLLFISVTGIYGTLKHHQVLLFIYMVVLAGIFIIQFSVSIACLSFTKDDEITLAQKAWEELRKRDNETIFTAEKYFGCCGFNSNNITDNDGYNCNEIQACKGVDTSNSTYACSTCKAVIEDKIGYAFSASGGVGLFFSFTEIVGAIMAYRYRNLMDPQMPPLPTGSLYPEGSM